MIFKNEWFSWRNLEFHLHIQGRGPIHIPHGFVLKGKYGIFKKTFKVYY